jgi:hypothetical protein
MASRKAKLWLTSIGTPILEKPHTGLELGNFAAGTGTGRYAMPYHIIRMDRQTGDSKTTVGYGATLADARRDTYAMADAHGMDNDRARWTYYIRDIRNGKIYK